ncbi:MAG: DUF4129 domain-containing protein [Chloroflexi bacterium]|nr:DUF4129 domain-containing protein [Chloroflexota bacterium]
MKNPRKSALTPALAGGARVRVPISLRRELRFALLAAMETCWTYAVLAVFAALAGTRPISAFAIFLAYWIALATGRILPRSNRNWLVLQLAAIAIAVITILAVARIELYARLDPDDLMWVPRFIVGFLMNWVVITPERFIGLGILFAFVRGLTYAQRPLTLWFVGFRFRVGVVVLLFTAAVASVTVRLDLTTWVVAFFGVALLAVALARIEENSDQTHLGPRWAITLLAAIAFVLFLGGIAAQVFTLDLATAFLGLLSPMWMLLSTVLLLFAIPFGFLAEWLVEFLRPLMRGLSRVIENVQGMFPRAPNENTQDVLTFLDQFAQLLPLLKVAFVLAVVLAIGYVIARALHRRMTQIEAETYARESIESDERVQRAPMTKPRQAKWRPPSIAAESIRRIYAALAAHARQAGLPRQIAETPYEYLPRLSNTWSEERDDLREITEAYVATHYAERDLSAELARVRAAWERIKSKTKNVKRET